jgi:hypothetical protein
MSEYMRTLTYSVRLLLCCMFLAAKVRTRSAVMRLKPHGLCRHRQSCTVRLPLEQTSAVNMAFVFDKRRMHVSQGRGVLPSCIKCIPLGPRQPHLSLCRRQLHAHDHLQTCAALVAGYGRVSRASPRTPMPMFCVVAWAGLMPGCARSPQRAVPLQILSTEACTQVCCSSLAALLSSLTGLGGLGTQMQHCSQLLHRPTRNKTAQGHMTASQHA